MFMLRRRPRPRARHRSVERLIEGLEPRSLPSTAVWQGFARDPQHTATSSVASLPLTEIRWSVAVDQQPQYSGDYLHAHYGSPLATAAGTVIVPVKTGASGGFEVQARQVGDGTLNWRVGTDYLLPAHNWVPSFGPTLTPSGRLIVPAAGGTVLAIADADAPTTPSPTRLAFFGIDKYQAGTFNTSVYINTPITAGAAGDLYFGFLATGTNPPLGLRSGIARIDAGGVGTWIAAADAASDSGIAQVVTNCAPALSLDGKTLYVAVNTGYQGRGALLALDSTTLAPRSRVALKDPATGRDASLSGDGTASPTVGPDGDVYYGVVENPFGSHRGRGWLLHFSADLQTVKPPGTFGWDATPSIVPAAMVPAYQGSSSYLLLVKSNNYVELGGDGVHKMVILDPASTQAEPGTGVIAMRSVLEIAGPTPDPDHGGNAVREWCINTAAVDPATHSVLVNNEDGVLYRWDLTTNTLTQKIVLTTGLVEAYTPTVIAGDGTVLAINDARLYAVGRLNVNHAPHAVDDAYTAIQNTPLSIAPALGVLSNDQDSDGDPLQAAQVDPPAHGSLTLNPDGSFLYSPAADYLGSDAFTYKASDGKLNSNVATVRIVVRRDNHPPVAVDDTYSTAVGQTLGVAPPGVLANDFDPDGDRIIPFLVIAPRHGSFRLGFDGSFTYTPSPGFRGVDIFQYHLSDGFVTGHAATVTIRVIDPNGPSAVTAQPVIAEQGAALNGVVVGTILHGSSPGTSGGLTAVIDWGDGTTSGAAIAPVDSTLSNITGNHVYDVPGTYTITVTATARVGGGSYTSSAPATVTPVSIALGGTFALPPGFPMSPAGVPISGSGVPTIVGTAPAGWQVQVVAPPRGVVGVVTAGPDGRFQVTTLAMPEGTFPFSLTATNPAAQAMGSRLVLQAPVGGLIVDTAPPRIQSVRLIRRTGRIRITFFDSGSGIDLTTLLGTSSYALTQPGRRGSVLLTITGILDLGPTAKPGTRQVALVVEGGRRLRSARYGLIVRSGLVRDLAGKALDGELRRRGPSGNGLPGGDFAAAIDPRGRLRPLSPSPRRRQPR